MKRAVAVLALILLIVSSVALAVDLDLDSKRDFRGVACGAGVPSDMKKQNDLFASEYHWWESSHWKSGTVAYKRNKDDLAIANVQLSSVTYYFFEGRFLGASVEVKKGDLFSSLSTAIGTKAIEQETRLGDCEHTWKGQSLIVVGTGQCTSVLGSRDALAIEAMTGERLAEQLARSGDFICAEELTGKEQDRHKIIVGEEAKKLNAARPKKGDL